MVTGRRLLAILRTPDEKAAHAKKMYVWGHNALRGQAKMMESNALAILKSPSTTEAAKKIAQSILVILPRLHKELETRVDPK